MTGRSLNQKALSEAIRQGQAKIAKGLKTGQMRSDGPYKELLKKAKPASGNSEFSGIRDESGRVYKEEVSDKPNFAVSAKVLLIGMAAVVQILVLAVGFWLGTIYSQKGAVQSGLEPKQESPSVIIRQEQKTAAATPEPVKEPLVPVRKETEVPKPVPIVSEELPRLKPEKGTNVIVIQGISLNRKNELKPIQDYFISKGIETEIIENRGYGLLVTKQLFMQDPAIEGTDGYEMKKRIQQLGLLYPAETGDTNFGLKPFQDAYGLKR